MKNFPQQINPSKTILSIILVGLVILGSIYVSIFYFKKRSPKPPLTKISPIQSSPVFNEVLFTKRLIKPEDIALEKVQIIPQIPKYNLPLKTKDIANYPKFSQKIRLSSRALSLLEKNGFVAITTPKEIANKESVTSIGENSKISYPKDDFAAFYIALQTLDLPIFITTDSLLHFYHILFNTTLMKLEKDLFYSDLWLISKEFFDDALFQYNKTSGDLKEAAKRNVAYFSVALELLKPKPHQVATKENIQKEIECYLPSETCEEIISNQLKEGKLFSLFTPEEFKKYSFQPPDFVKDLVQKEIQLIENHKGWENSPIFIYKEDYSQYIPRGHYSRSEKLKNYFKAMMWYGRMTTLIKGSPNLPKGVSKCSEYGIISEYDAKIQTLQASLIASKFLKSHDIQKRWERIYKITSFFVGFSDDLGPYEYSIVLKSLFKGEIKLEKLEEKYSEIKNILLNLPYNPKIYGGLGACQLSMPCPPLSDQEIQELKLQEKKLIEATKGLRLMGQRFTIDSWFFSELVSPYSGIYIGNKTTRPFTLVKTQIPGCQEGREIRGFPRGLDIMALLGSKRAKEILKELGDTAYSDYEKKFSELKKELDTLPQYKWFENLYWGWLYVLKSLLGEFGEGYQTFMQTKAWQDKELNTALASWAELRHDTILYTKQSYTGAEMGSVEEPPIVGYVEPIPEFYARLLTLTKITSKGLKELIPKENLEKLKIEEVLTEFSKILTKLLEISKKELENKPLNQEEYDFIQYFGVNLENLVRLVAQAEPDPDIFKTTLIADVHTESNTKKVLEEGVGYIKTLVVAYKLPDGRILIGVGPIFSYYEFKQPMENRLTNETWRLMLQENPPSSPEWTRSFSE